MIQLTTILLFCLCASTTLSAGSSNILKASPPSGTLFSKTFNNSLLLPPTSADAEDLTTFIYWNVLPASKEIQFGVETVHTGYFGFGVSDSGSMKGASMYILTEQANFAEYFTPKAGYPLKAKIQNVDKFSVSSAPSTFSNTTTAWRQFTFTRPLAGCDLEHFSLSLDHPVWLIYAWGNTPYLSHHASGRRGQVLVDLSGSYFQELEERVNNAATLSSTSSSSAAVDSAAKKVESSFTIDLISPPTVLPANESTVYCYSLYDLEKDFNLIGKHQIIGEDYKIGSTLTHHFVGYFCESNMEKDFPTKDTVKCNYYRENYTSFDNTCSAKIYLAWAKGGKKRMYPASLGKPISHSQAFRYLLVETHFANAHVLPGNQTYTDNGSGFKLTVTEDLRPIDVGMLTIGRGQESILIPPKQPSFEIYNECSGKCTGMKNVLPEEGVNILSTQLHMHKRGKSMFVQHVRDGVELEPLPSMKYFDFDFQSYMWPSKGLAKLLPGDRIVSRCVYDSSTDLKEVVGGYSSEQEMCYNFIEYYPLQEHFQVCLAVGNETNHYKEMLNVCHTENKHSGKRNRTSGLVKLGENDLLPFNPFNDGLCPVVSSPSEDDQPSSFFDPTLLVILLISALILGAISVFLWMKPKFGYSEIPSLPVTAGPEETA